MLLTALYLLIQTGLVMLPLSHWQIHCAPSETSSPNLKVLKVLRCTKLTNHQSMVSATLSVFLGLTGFSQHWSANLAWEQLLQHPFQQDSTLRSLHLGCRVHIPPKPCTWVPQGIVSGIPQVKDQWLHPTDAAGRWHN